MVQQSVVFTTLPQTPQYQIFTVATICLKLAEGKFVVKDYHETIENHEKIRHSWSLNPIVPNN